MDSHHLPCAHSWHIFVDSLIAGDALINLLTLPRRLAQLGALPLAQVLHSDSKQTDVALCVVLSVLTLVQKMFWDRSYLDHLTRLRICLNMDQQPRAHDTLRRTLGARGAEKYT